LSGTFVVYYTDAETPPTVGGGSAAIGLNPWEGASKDDEWQADQAEFLILTAKADLEVLDLDP
jgi:hypothetical protein